MSGDEKFGVAPELWDEAALYPYKGKAIRVTVNDSETFQPTMALRWRETSETLYQTNEDGETEGYAARKVRVLEQAWQGDKGGVMWKPVPTVIDA